MWILLLAVLAVLRALLIPKAALALENAAIRQQLAALQRSLKKTRLHPGDRAFWVLLNMEIGSRRIVHWGVTTSPILPWVKQQLREATPWGETPRFLIHDNDGIFGQYRTKPIVDKDGHKRSYRCHLDLWLDTVMGIDGIPIPYGAPNANAHIERFNRTLREDALDHFIFLGVGHVRKVVAGFVEYYNRARPSQAIHGIRDPYPELKRPPLPDGKLVALPVLGGIHHDYRLAA